MEKAQDVNKSCCERFTHGLIWLLEVLPVVGAVASIFEVVIVKAGGHKEQTPTPQAPPPLIPARVKPAAPVVASPAVPVDTPTPVLAPVSKPPAVPAFKAPPVSASAPQPPARVILSTPAASKDARFRTFLESYVPPFERNSDGKSEATDPKAAQQNLAKAVLSNPDAALKTLRAAKEKYDDTHKGLEAFLKNNPSFKKTDVKPAASIALNPPTAASVGKTPPPPPPPGVKAPPPPPLKPPNAHGVPKEPSHTAPKLVRATSLSAQTILECQFLQLEEAHKPNVEAIKKILLEGYEPEELEGLKIGHEEIEGLSFKYMKQAEAKKAANSARSSTPRSSPVSSPAQPELSEMAKTVNKYLDDLRRSLEEVVKQYKSALLLIGKCQTTFAKLQKSATSQLVGEFNSHAGDLKKLSSPLKEIKKQLDKLQDNSLKKYFPELITPLKKEAQRIDDNITALEEVSLSTDLGELEKKFVFVDPGLTSNVVKKLDEVKSGAWQEPSKKSSILSPPQPKTGGSAPKPPPRK